MNRGVTGQDKVIMSHGDMLKAASVQQSYQNRTFGFNRAHFVIPINNKYKYELPLLVA